MKRTVLPNQLQLLLKRIPYVTIATVCPDGQPWNSPVVGRFDDNLNLYWVSWMQSQHSMNIANEPRILVVIYDSRVPEGQGEGLYLKMEAHEITGQELSEAKTVYQAGFFKHQFEHAQFAGTCPRRMYKAVTKQLWYNIDADESGHVIDKRAEIIHG